MPRDLPLLLRRLLPPLLVVAGSLLAFLPALQAGFVNWDDDKYFLTNPAYRGLSWDHLEWMFTTFHYGGYYPVAWITYGLDHELWGMDARGYHLTNLLLHGVTSVLVYVVILDLLAMGSGGPTARRRWAAALGALLFAVHPLRVETVAWVVERRGILAGLFWLIALLLYLRAHRRERRFMLLALSVGAFLLSLLSKGFAITLPFVLLVLDIWPLGRWRRSRLVPLLLEKVPWFVVAAGVGLLARAAQAEGAAVVSWAQHGLVERLAQAAYGLAFYVAKTVLPWGLSPLHPLEGRLDPTELRFLVSAVFVIGLTFFLAKRARRRPAPLVAWITYGLTILPVLGLTQSGPQLVAERYSYTACVPFAALVAAGIAAVRPRPWLALAAVGCGLLAVLTWVQCSVWQSSVALWERVVTVYPDGIAARFNLGCALTEQGRDGDAAPHFERCVALFPDHDGAWHNLGMARHRLGRHEAALPALARAAELRPDNPDQPYAQALASLALGRHDDVIRFCRAALSRNERFVHAYPMMAEAYRAKGDLRQARDNVASALSIDPDNAHARKLREELGR